MKYDRAIDGSDISSEKRRFGGKVSFIKDI